MSAESGIRQRTIRVGRQTTSVTLEDEFWMGLRDLARSAGATITQTVTAIDAAKTRSNLSSSIRVAVLEYYKRSPAIP